MDVQRVVKVTSAVSAALVILMYLVMAMAMESTARTPLSTQGAFGPPRVLIRVTDSYFWFDIYW